MKKLLGIILGMSFLLPGVSTKALTNISGRNSGLSAVSAKAEESISEAALPSESDPLHTDKTVTADSVNLQLNAKAAYMMDWASGTEIYSSNATDRLPIASMCKIMTLILCFDAIEAGNLSLDEMISVSEHAASMGGSQVFLEANAQYPARELIKSIIVCSANDSCVAMAERIAGSDTLFTDKMNARAKELGAENTLRYRNKVQLPVAPGPRIGFFRARSHDVVNVEDCLLQPETASALRRAVLAWMLEWGVPAYEEETHTGLLRHLYLRFSRTQVLCCLVVNSAKPLPGEEALVSALRAAAPGLAGVAVSVNQERTNVVLGRELRSLWGHPWLDDTLCGLTFRISVPSFYQVNRDQAEVLYEQALAFAGLTGHELVLDLYCGIGTISLVMARRAGKVIGAEIVPSAVTDAKANAARNGITNADFLCGDAGTAAQHLAMQGLRPDVICVDPPRKGLSAEVCDAIADMAPARVVYVSCDPATLARDVRRLHESGYRPEKAVAVDMFPRTAHVETVVLLQREAG